MTGSNGSRRTVIGRLGGRNVALVTLALVGAAVIGSLAVQGRTKDLSGPPVEVLGQAVDADAIQIGRELYAANCASCHGANLEGQPDWKTPLPSERWLHPYYPNYSQPAASRPPSPS